MAEGPALKLYARFISFSFDDGNIAHSELNKNREAIPLGRASLLAVPPKLHADQGKKISPPSQNTWDENFLAVPPKLPAAISCSLYRANPSDSSFAAPERNIFALLLSRIIRQLSESLANCFSFIALVL